MCVYIVVCMYVAKFFFSPSVWLFTSFAHDTRLNIRTAFVAEARQIVAEETNAKITGKASLDVVLFA